MLPLSGYGLIGPSINFYVCLFQEYNRMWRKNRQPFTNLPIIKRFCIGTDLNRNFGYHWRQGNGSSTNPCMERYSGPSEFSAPEAKNMANYIKTIQTNLAAYLSFHSYGQYILLPYGDSNVPAENAVEEFDVAIAAANSIKKKYGTEYKIGTDIQLLQCKSIWLSNFLDHSFKEIFYFRLYEWCQYRLGEILLQDANCS